MSILRVGALCFARAFRVVSIREAYPFPTLLLCCCRCIPSVPLLGLIEKFFMQAPKDVIRIRMQPRSEIPVLRRWPEAQCAFGKGHLSQS